MPTLDETLAERGSRYGDFTSHARIAQALQGVMRSAANPFGSDVTSDEWNRLSDVQKQALTVIADKIARILNGDPNYADNWHDIADYAKLVEDRLQKPTVKLDVVYDECGAAIGLRSTKSETPDVAMSRKEYEAASYEELVAKIDAATSKRSGKIVYSRTKDDNKTRVYDVPRPPLTPRA